jgi:hypothetical protein
MSRLNFSNEEKLSLQNNVLREQNLGLQITQLQNERQNFINDFCKKVSRKPEDILTVDVNSGFIEFKEEEVSEKK